MKRKIILKIMFVNFLPGKRFQIRTQRFYHLNIFGCCMSGRPLSASTFDNVSKLKQIFNFVYRDCPTGMGGTETPVLPGRW